jgi:2,3-bisphosphoglycerate-independent phosphoglycerate mutase
LISQDSDNIKLENGTLADIAPTILALMKLEKPNEMNGKNLIN